MELETQSVSEKDARRFQPIGEVAIMPPQDIHRKWYNVIRRSSKNVVGCAIVSINVVINDRGVPVIWTEPKCTLIEPMKDNTQLLELLGKNL